MYLGLDDTDSPDGMCTTYLGSLIAEAIEDNGCIVKNMRLIRLNPNVPWKTRGNAGVCIEFDNSDDEELSDGGKTSGEIKSSDNMKSSDEMRSSDDLIKIVSGIVEAFIEKYAMFECENTNPGYVICSEKPAPDFYYRALRDFCTVDEAKVILDELRATYKGYKNGRGLIGSLAAVSAVLPDKTYEYLAYRKPEAFGTERVFKSESIKRMEEATTPHTWDSWDFASDKPVCIPHGKDPVLFGIRGDTPASVEAAVKYIECEAIDRFVIWETNQGTDAHMMTPEKNGFLEGRSYVFDCIVASKPVTQEGGHVSFVATYKDKETLCYAFEPTKSFRDVVRKLEIGDSLTVYGSFMNSCIHIEKFRLNEVAKKELRESPKCPECGGRMTSAGKGKGYKCRSCGGRVREVLCAPRDIDVGWYEVPPDARRHLAKPVVRIIDETK